MTVALLHIRAIIRLLVRAWVVDESLSAFFHLSIHRIGPSICPSIHLPIYLSVRPSRHLFLLGGDDDPASDGRSEGRG